MRDACASASALSCAEATWQAIADAAVSAAPDAGACSQAVLAAARAAHARDDCTAVVLLLAPRASE